MTEQNKTEKFPSMEWYDVAERVSKATFRLYTNESMGTGFLISVGKSEEGYMATIATAWHVIEDAMKGTSLRICASTGDEIVRSKSGNIAVIEVGDNLDSGLIFVLSETELFSQQQLLPILPDEVQLKTGAEIGWMGYPGILEPELCFFHGFISGMKKYPPVYLVDGVAINGVSGGPVFDNRCHIVGLVSAYLPNQINKFVTLPGVSFMVPINFILGWMKAYLKPKDIFNKE